MSVSIHVNMHNFQTVISLRIWKNLQVSLNELYNGEKATLVWVNLHSPVCMGCKDDITHGGAILQCLPEHLCF